MESIAVNGVLVALRITPDGDGFRVIDGGRRLAAALKAGLAEVPCDLVSDRAGDEAGQYLDMINTNRPVTRLPRWKKPMACSPPGRQARPRPGCAKRPA